MSSYPLINLTFSIPATGVHTQSLYLLLVLGQEQHYP